MSEPEMTFEEAIYVIARGYFNSGVPFEQIEQELLRRGASPELIAPLLPRLRAEKVQQTRADGKFNLIAGGLMCAAGIVITVLTRRAAANAGGGSFLLAWGPIIFGGIQFFRGMLQMGEPLPEERAPSNAEDEANL